jgi:hypothetical protein
LENLKHWEISTSDPLRKFIVNYPLDFDTDTYFSSELTTGEVNSCLLWYPHDANLIVAAPHTEEKIYGELDSSDRTADAALKRLIEPIEHIVRPLAYGLSSLSTLIQDVQDHLHDPTIKSTLTTSLEEIERCCEDAFRLGAHYASQYQTSRQQIYLDGQGLRSKETPQNRGLFSEANEENIIAQCKTQKILADQLKSFEKLNTNVSKFTKQSNQHKKHGGGKNSGGGYHKKGGNGGGGGKPKRYNNNNRKWNNNNGNGKRKWNNNKGKGKGAKSDSDDLDRFTPKDE